MQWTKLVLPRGLVPATMAGLLAAGVVLVGWSFSRTDRMLRDDSVQQVQLVADAVNANDLAILQDTNHDLRAILTRRLNSQLFAIQRSIPQCRRISLFGHTPDGALNCLASSVPPGIPGNGRPGRSLGASLEVVLQVAETGEPSVDGPFGTGSDTKVSAIAPIRNPRTNAIMGVLVMDRAAQAWQRELAQAAIPPVLLTAVLMAIVLAWRKLQQRRVSAQPGVRRWTNHPEPVLVVATGVILTLFGCWTAHQNEHRTRRESFTRLAESRTTAIAEALDDLGDIELEGMARFFGGSEHVTPEEFVQYVGYLARNPILRAWGWAPAVSKAEAERFTAEARAAGHAKFTIWQQGRDGKRNAAAVRAWHYPLQYIMCSACERALFGYDLGSEPRYRAVLDEAAETGLTAAAEAITPIAESGNMREVLCVRPVFRGSNRAHLQGYVLAILRVQTLLEAGGRDDVTCMELSVLNPTGRSEPLGTTVRTAGQTEKAFSLTRPVFVFGNVFAVTAYADEGFYRDNPARAAWMTMLTGLLLTASLAVAVFGTLRRRDELESQVMERTAALRASEQWLAATLHSISDGVIACDCQGRVTSINKVGEMMTGWSTEDASGRAIEEVFQVIDSRTRSKSEVPTTRALRDGVTVTLANHTALIARDGTERHVADSCAPIRDDAGAIIGAVLVFRDVTDEYRRREELAEERRRFDYILSATKTGFDIVDSQFNLRYVDPSAEKIYGNPKGKTCHEYYRGLDRPCSGCSIRQALDSKQTVIRKEVMPWENNRVMEIHTIPIQDSSGEWLAAEFKLDVTERQELIDRLEAKNRQLKLAESRAIARARFSSALNQMDVESVYESALRVIAAEIESPLVAVFEGNADSLSCGCAIGIDRQVLDAEQLLPEGLPRTVARSREVVTIRGPFDGSALRLRVGVGDVGLHAIIGWPILFQRHCVGVLLTATTRSLTDEQAEFVKSHLEHLAIRMKTIQIDAERARYLADLRAQAKVLERAKAEAERANLAKSTFLANMSHELRTPMNSVLGFTDRLMKKSLSEPMTERDLTAVEIIDRNAKHLLDLINSILDLSKIEAGRMELAASQFDLRDVIRDVTGRTTALAEAEGLDIRTELPDSPMLVTADRVKVVQILTNLVSNAVKYTERGSVTVTATRTEDDSLGAVARIAVRDTGIGIKEEDLGRLFTTFTQLASSKRRIGGTGLGLCIAQQYAHLHGGRIDVRSEFGKGSEFTLVLPRTASGSPESPPVMELAMLPPVEPIKADMAAAIERPIWTAETRGISILCVDDDPDALEFLRVTFEDVGYEVLLADGHDTAISQAKTHHPDVICLDIKMPDKDGFDVMKTLRSDPTLATVPVVVVSITSRDAETLTSGARYWLKKPIDVRELLSTVRHVLAGADPKALVVDDDPDIRRLVTTALSDHGIAVRTAENGEEALDRLAETLPSVIVLDLMMPVMDGFDFLDRIQTIPQYTGIPVIILTAKMLTQEEIEKLQSLSQVILTKGRINSEQLVDTILKAVIPNRKVLEKAAP